MGIQAVFKVQVPSSSPDLLPEIPEPATHSPATVVVDIKKTYFVLLFLILENYKFLV